VKRRALVGLLLLALYAVCYAWGAGAASAATGATDNADLNTCLQAIVTNFEGQLDNGSDYLGICAYADDADGNGDPGWFNDAPETADTTDGPSAVANASHYEDTANGSTTDGTDFTYVGAHTENGETLYLVATDSGHEFANVDSGPFEYTTTDDVDAAYTLDGGADALTWADTTGGTTTVTVSDPSTTVALDADDATRLDYIWWGVWLSIGVGLIALIAPAFHRAFPWGRTAS